MSIIQSNSQESSGQYTAFLVRLWQAGPHTPWRASAQSARTGEKIRFAELGDLFTFLQGQVEMTSGPFAQPTHDDVTTSFQ